MLVEAKSNARSNERLVHGQSGKANDNYILSAVLETERVKTHYPTHTFELITAQGTKLYNTNLICAHNGISR